MDSNIIDGRALAAKHEEALKESIKGHVSSIKVVSILVGNDPSSVQYTSMKQKKAQELGINFEPIRFSTETEFNVVAETIQQFNDNPSVNGIMIQLPIPDEFLKNHDWRELPHLIRPEKDIDGLTPNGPFLSATAKAVLSIINDERLAISEKRIVVIGKSDLVGKPVAVELKKMGGRITIIERKTKNPAQIASTADILISAAGSPKLVKENWVRPGAVVIDVGTSELNGQIVGDVDFDSVSKKTSKITPSPGGVGPMTVISLMENAVNSITNSKF
jgi:methylenetetrahydrofolate dehydrogenase (NADP+) / methenyltetrahydrofolate cyclohydrolase